MIFFKYFFQKILLPLLPKKKKKVFFPENFVTAPTKKKYNKIYKPTGPPQIVTSILFISISAFLSSDFPRLESSPLHAYTYKLTTEKHIILANQYFEAHDRVGKH
jgi:hypothetical protein